MSVRSPWSRSSRGALVLLMASVLGACGSVRVPGPAGPTPGGTDTPTDATASGPHAPGRRPIRYVALGDSYTIGTAVREPERWPNRLVEALRPGHDLLLVANPAANGYTTDDLIRDELPVLERTAPDLVSILIGVNDVVRGRDEDRYRANLGIIFAAVLAVVPPERVFVVSTPDYTRTPQGAAYGDPGRQRARIASFNRVLADEARTRGVAYVDISPVAHRAGDDARLVAEDGLHPSGEQYRQWVERIAPVVRRLLDGSASR